MVNSATKGHRLSTAIRLLAWGFGLLYVYSRLLPARVVKTYPSGRSIDDAWTEIMHVAFVQHLQFGRDIVFTYGPWGFLARGYYPATFLISMAAWFVLASVFICAGWRVARSFTQNESIAWIWLIGFTALASLPIGYDISNRLAAWAVLLLFLHFFVETGPFSVCQAMLVFTLGWLGLVKFTGFMEGVFLVAIIAADNVVRHRRFPWVIPLWLASVLFFWLLAGQQMRWLWPFLKNSWEVTNGYGDAMSLGDIFVLNPLIFAVVAAGFCVLGIILIKPPHRAARCFFAAGLSGILFLTFKQGYVRDDNQHEVIAAITLLLTGLACVAMAVSQKKRLLIAALGLVCISTIMAWSKFNGSIYPASFYLQLTSTLEPENLFSPLTGLLWSHRLRHDRDKKLAYEREKTPLPPVQGGADLYDCYQGALFANGIDYHPRPVIQSYSAYTPGLAQMNAEWLRSDRAAANIFFAIQAFDERFPSLDDGFSWPELLTRYDILGRSDPAGTYLRLSRSTTPREYRLAPLQETTVVLGKPFALPITNGPVWAEIEIKETLAGHLCSFFYKPTVLTAGIELADHTEKTVRIIPGMARAGFLVSPYIADNASFLALAEGDQAVLSSQAVASLTFHESGGFGPAFCYQPQIKIRFYRPDFPKQKIHFKIPQNLSGDRQVK